jgi:hypothetical protein
MQRPATHRFPKQALRRCGLWLSVLWVLHLLGVIGLFGARTLLGTLPVVEVDLGMHFYRAARLREAGGFPGLVWDPGFMAGYPLGGATDVDNRLGELGVSLLSFLPPGTAWNWTLFVLFCAVPALVFVTARWAGCSRTNTAIATLLGTLAFWSTRVGDFAFLGYGMYGWVVAAAAIPLMFVSLQRCLEKPTTKSALGLAAATTLAGLAHALTVTYVPIMGLIVLSRSRALRRNHLLALLFAAALTGLLVYPCARPVLATLGDLEPGAGLSVTFQSSPSYILELLRSERRAFPNAVLFLGILGVLFRRLKRTSRELMLVSAGVTVTSLLHFLVPGLGDLQPARNLTPALFLAVIPAAECIDWLRGRVVLSRRILQVACIAVASIAVFPAAYDWSGAILGHRRLATQPSAQAQALVQYLKENTTADARILMEDDEFFVDLVFYNRLLQCFVIIEIKTQKLTHQDLGQLQMYVN